jgi:ribosomal protein S18 acetylase RimI-like enzyme
MANYQFKRGTESMVQTLQTLSIETFRETFGDQNDPEDLALFLKKAYGKDKLIQEIRDNDVSFHLLYVAGEVAGYLKLNVDTAQTDIHAPEALEIERIYIKRGFQGMGLGNQLMSKAIEEAARLEKQFLWLGVWEKNAHALGFYRHQGFYPIGKHAFVVGSDLQTDLLMRKDLKE